MVFPIVLAFSTFPCLINCLVVFNYFFFCNLCILLVVFGSIHGFFSTTFGVLAFICISLCIYGAILGDILSNFESSSTYLIWVIFLLFYSSPICHGYTLFYLYLPFIWFRIIQLCSLDSLLNCTTAVVPF